jgi:hypothetical protein
MAAFGGDDIDTLALLFDKLQYIFRGYDSYIQVFTEMHEFHKQGKLSEREYYNGMTDAVLKFSALEFLGLKAMFEIKKALNRMNNFSSVRTSTHGLFSGNTAGDATSEYQTSLTSFISAKSLPGRDEFIRKITNATKHCSCGKPVQSTAKFCVNCGSKI